MSNEWRKANAEFSYGIGRSTSNVWHHLESHHTVVAVEYRAAQNAKKVAKSSSMITDHFHTAGGCAFFTLHNFANFNLFITASPTLASAQAFLHELVVKKGWGFNIVEDPAFRAYSAALKLASIFT